MVFDDVFVFLYYLVLCTMQEPSYLDEIILVSKLFGMVLIQQ